MFKVGDKVVCVDPIAGLVKDKIYTITGGFNCICGKSYNSYGQKSMTNIGTCTCGITLTRSATEDIVYSYRFRKLDHAFGRQTAERIEQEINQEQLITI